MSACMLARTPPNPLVLAGPLWDGPLWDGPLWDGPFRDGPAAPRNFA